MKLRLWPKAAAVWEETCLALDQHVKENGGERLEDMAPPGPEERELKKQVSINYKKLQKRG